LGAETGRQKSPLKRATVCRDQGSGIGWPKVPAETPCLASYRKYAVCKGWMVEALGHKLETHHPVVEPVSPLSRERKFATAYHPPEISPETRRECESPHSGATPSFLADEAADAAG
jgi:hypothetical protein